VSEALRPYQRILYRLRVRARVADADPAGCLWLRRPLHRWQGPRGNWASAWGDLGSCCAEV